MSTLERNIAFVAITALLLALPPAVSAQQAQGGEVTVRQSASAQPAGSAAEEPVLSAEHERLHADFARFSEAWVQRLNNTHSQNRAHAKAVREGDGWVTRYHFIEKKSSVVRESPSRPGSFCGILRYQDTVLECQGDTETACQNGEFTPVPGSAMGVSEIFQYMKGAWR